MTYIEQLKKWIAEGKKEMQIRRIKYEGHDPFEPMDEEDERLAHDIACMEDELREKEGYKLLEDMGIEY